MSGVIRDSDKGVGSLIPKQEFLHRDENDDMSEFLEEISNYISGESFDFKSGVSYPRFGLLSLVSNNTPMYVYDHPALMEITNTAFTDGIHCFVCCDFLRELKDEYEKDNKQDGPSQLILHELMHRLLNHTRRLGMFSKQIANQATDLVINSQLHLSFPEMTFSTILSEVGLGFKPGEAEKYAPLAEETVARMLLAEEQKKKPKPGEDKDGKGGKDGKKKPSDGSGSPEDGPADGSGNPGGIPSKSGGKPGKSGGLPNAKKQSGQQDADKNDGNGGDDDADDDDNDGGNPAKDPTPGKWSDTHTLTLEELIETLEKNGLNNAIKALQLPESDDAEGIAEREAAVLSKDLEAINKMSMIRSTAGGSLPGDHILDAAVERVSGLRKGKLHWKLGLREWVLGGGMQFRTSDEEADPIFYVDAADMGLPNEIYQEAQLPHSPDEVVVCIVDVSGSMSNEMIGKCISECLSLQRGTGNIGDNAKKVILFSADTRIRGKPIEITEENVNEFEKSGVDVYGRGGTDIARCFKDVLELEEMKTKKIASFVYFTDTMDTPPDAKDFMEYVGKFGMAFITFPGTFQEEWVKALSPFARLYAIEEGTEVNLTKDNINDNVKTRANRVR